MPPLAQERFRHNIPNVSLRHWITPGTNGVSTNLSTLANVTMQYEAINGLHYGKFSITSPLANIGYIQPGDIISVTKSTWTAYNCTRKPISHVNKATGFAYFQLEFPDDTETGCTVYAHLPFNKVIISGAKSGSTANTSPIYIGVTPLGFHTLGALSHPVKIAAGASFTIEIPDGAQCDLSQLTMNVDTDADAASMIVIGR